jgi:hypothetical protein
VASSELGSFLLAYMQALGIDTAPEVHNFRIPGASRHNRASPGGTSFAAIRDTLSFDAGGTFISRRRMRSDALCLLREGQL